VPDEALARLGDDERAELVGLASTALLTRAAIEGAAPPRKEAEAASLQRAQERVATAEPRKSSAAARPARPTPAGWPAGATGVAATNEARMSEMNSAITAAAALPEGAADRQRTRRCLLE
jgi:hypothetical protein